MLGFLLRDGSLNFLFSSDLRYNIRLNRLIRAIDGFLNKFLHVENVKAKALLDVFALSVSSTEWVANQTELQVEPVRSLRMLCLCTFVKV